MYRPTTSRIFSTSCGSGESLNDSVTCGCRPKRPPDAADHRVTHARRLGHRPRAPVGLAGRRRLQRLHDEGLDLLVGDRAWGADARLVVQPREPARDELAAPFGHRRLRGPQAARHRRVRVVGTRQHDPGTKRQRAIHAARAWSIGRGPRAPRRSRQPRLGGVQSLAYPFRSQVWRFLLVISFPGD